MNNFRTLRATAVGLALAALVGGCAVDSLDDVLGPDADEIVFDPSLGIDLDDFTETGSGLLIRDDVVGDGAQALPGSNVTVETTGWLPNGSEFQATVEFDFQIGRVGQGGAIPGFDEGVTNMKVGGLRWLIIPPELAYGASSPEGSGIPDNSWLVFEVELLEAN